MAETAQDSGVRKKINIMKVFPIAKINLGLNVVEKRPDGYHNLQTVFCPVPIKDTLEILPATDDMPADEHCSLTISNIQIEGDPRKNLVVRAYQLLKEDFPTLPRVQAHLHKCIPTQAGMGGGSSDCAYTIRLLNEMFALGLSNKQMMDYAARLGADCAFFILSSPCYAEGIGERLQPIGLQLNGWHIGIVRPNIPVPTKEAFSRIHPHYPAKNCREVVMQPVETWREELTNDFEESVFALHPEIGHIKERLYKMGATYAAMSGSGSALYGLFRDIPANFSSEFPDMYIFCSSL
jgi:4-diphosphocytidyl-2-C-methyl-D-erythritol kinase